MKVRKFNSKEDAQYVRSLKTAQLDNNRVVLAKIVEGVVVFSVPLTSCVPVLLSEGWQVVRPSKKGHRRLRHKIRVIK